jgi:adenine-specific DNA-methyltransferase
MNREELQSVLKQPYQRDRWIELLRMVLPGTEVFASPQVIPTKQSHTDSILQLGRVRLRGGHQLAVLEAIVASGVDLTRNRVGLRNLVAPMIDLAEYHGVLALFHSSDSSDYRFTFAARESVFDPEGNVAKRETAPRRFTYVLGPNEACRTAAQRFGQLADKAHGAELNDVIDAFSVEKLNKEFFADYCRSFDKVCDEIAKRHRWVEATVKSEAQTLLNRLLFLYFVQRKGWLSRQRDFLIRNFRSGHIDNPKTTTYHDRFLHPLFERLSSDETMSLLPNDDLPFLNGGLFNDEYGNELYDESLRRRKELTLTNGTFQYIFERMLEPYNFTIHEDSPNNYEVAIDP